MWKVMTRGPRYSALCIAVLMIATATSVALEVRLTGYASGRNEPVWHGNSYRIWPGTGNCGDYALIDMLQWKKTDGAANP